MGYKFTNGAQQINYGTHSELFQPLDLSAGYWVLFKAGFIPNDEYIIRHEDSFPIISSNVLTLTSGHGLGVSFFHETGGAFRFGVNCVPGALDSRYTLGTEVWRYFGISRTASAKLYQSYFGSRATMIEAQSNNYGPTQGPIPAIIGQTLGPWVVGHGSFTMIVGPASYWDIPLTREQHLSLARCEMPTGVDPVHLLWRTKMLEGAADIGPNMWANTFIGSPLPEYVPDDGCTSFTTGLDYDLRST